MVNNTGYGTQNQMSIPSVQGWLSVANSTLGQMASTMFQKTRVEDSCVSGTGTNQSRSVNVLSVTRFHAEFLEHSRAFQGILEHFGALPFHTIGLSTFVDVDT